MVLPKEWRLFERENHGFWVRHMGIERPEGTDGGTPGPEMPA